MKRHSWYRIWAIVTMTIKFFVQIMWFQRKHPKPWDSVTMSDWESLLQKQAIEYRQTAIKLEGLLIKVGQFLSTRADLLPDVFLGELENLVDQVPAVPWDQVKKTLDAEWQGDYRTVLREIRTEPIASASIGVVYHGYLHDGSSVAVKVRRPGIDHIIRADFRAIRLVIFLARRFTKLGHTADLLALYREMVVVIRDELNFLKELQNGEYFRKKYESYPGVQIPQFFSEYSTRSVLVMEWVNAAKISDISFIEENDLNRQQLAARLFRCFAEQLFFGGRFHADPHPGNLLIKEDGTLVLIDFGMIGSIGSEDAKQIRRLIEGILFEDADKMIDSLEQLRFLLPHADKRQIKQAIASLLELYQRQSISTFDETVLDEMLHDIQMVFKQQPIQLPSEFAFLGRALSTFVGVLHILNPGVDLVVLGKPIIKQWLEEEAKSGDHAVLRWAKDVSGPISRLPRLIEHYLQAPKEQLEWKQEEFQRTLIHTYYAQNRWYAFWFFIICFILFAGAVYSQRGQLIHFSIVCLILSILVFLYMHLRYYRWIRSLRRRR